MRRNEGRSEARSRGWLCEAAARQAGVASLIDGQMDGRKERSRCLVRSWPWWLQLCQGMTRCRHRHRQLLELELELELLRLWIECWWGPARPKPTLDLGSSSIGAPVHTLQSTEQPHLDLAAGHAQNEPHASKLKSHGQGSIPHVPLLHRQHLGWCLLPLARYTSASALNLD